MSEVIVISPQATAILKECKDKKECLQSYLAMVNSLSALPDEFLVDGALDYAKRIKESGQPDVTGNAWLQALSLRDAETARSVQEMIDKETC